ncbi:putative transposase, Ptta/En/Spm, plant [Helianthus annuus]|nr:putative transposase, Ptta/En/Spm, plant [Helianthus annuus]
MRQLRITSTMMASRVREDMDPNNYLQFDIIRDYPPHSMSLEVWRALCRRWNTPGWLNKSKSGSRNRRSGNMNGKSSRHTGGSMGYAERRARMVS